jgi:L-fucose mutarotase
VQRALLEAAATSEDKARFLDRHDFYGVAAEAYLIVRTGETRTYGNVILRKGVVS